MVLGWESPPVSYTWASFGLVLALGIASGASLITGLSWVQKPNAWDLHSLWARPFWLLDCSGETYLSLSVTLPLFISFCGFDYFSVLYSLSSKKVETWKMRQREESVSERKQLPCGRNTAGTTFCSRCVCVFVCVCICTHDICIWGSVCGYNTDNSGQRLKTQLVVQIPKVPPITDTHTHANTHFHQNGKSLDESFLLTLFVCLGGSSSRGIFAVCVCVRV